MPHIPDSRIKVIEAMEFVNKDLKLPPKYLEAMLVERMGTEIARKLFEFRKIAVKDQGAQMLYHGRFEVIVPYGPPK